MDKPAEALRTAWRLIRERAENRRRTSRLRREVASLDPRERGRIFADGGLTSDDYVLALSAPYALEDLLSSALGALGVDPDEFRCRNGGWGLDMDRVCMACPVRRRCRRDLARSEFSNRYQRYCPNADSLARIAGDVAEQEPKGPGNPVNAQA